MRQNIFLLWMHVFKLFLTMDAETFTYCQRYCARKAHNAVTQLLIQKSSREKQTQNLGDEGKASKLLCEDLFKSGVNKLWFTN